MYSFSTSSSRCYFNVFPARSICKKMCKILKFKYACNIRIKRILLESRRNSASTIPSTAILFTLFIFRKKMVEIKDHRTKLWDPCLGSATVFFSMGPLIQSCHRSVSFHCFRLVKVPYIVHQVQLKLILLIVAASNT